jgi:hypothetical protein
LVLLGDETLLVVEEKQGERAQDVALAENLVVLPIVLTNAVLENKAQITPEVRWLFVVVDVQKVCNPVKVQGVAVISFRSSTE